MKTSSLFLWFFYFLFPTSTAYLEMFGKIDLDWLNPIDWGIILYFYLMLGLMVLATAEFFKS